jgi:hypothetical protein
VATAKAVPTTQDDYGKQRRGSLILHMVPMGATGSHMLWLLNACANSTAAAPSHCHPCATASVGLKLCLLLLLVLLPTHSRCRSWTYCT